MTKPKTPKANQPPFQKPDHEAASAALKLMAETPRNIPPEELVQKDYDVLSKCLRRGYNYTNIANTYGDNGIKVTAAKLKLEFEKQRDQKQQEQEQQETPSEVPTSSSAASKLVKRS
ncbi:hypothetical protein K9N68_39900 (plasmid) [Kovacikia minuta CCNUW1]|uniref:hypothetical protein n=1 Tax=Kovacikia minuta TaxID=2931930 RepID=UPI001CCED105|nr:hypothetical protein [Kovacikia minuta]UBF30762.1 hypothetical protein K9N68_39900 [Kovacikia minuta CCNUW1]